MNVAESLLLLKYSSSNNGTRAKGQKVKEIMPENLNTSAATNVNYSLHKAHDF